MERPIPIRAHTLLCLQGFRGEGYSPRFIRTMQQTLASLRADPERKVRVGEQPDLFCEACPNLAPNGCGLRDPGFETVIRAQDRRVLQLLGIENGRVTTWAEILERIGRNMRGEMLPDLCGDCQWLALGTCAEGIERLRTTIRPPAATLAGC